MPDFADLELKTQLVGKDVDVLHLELAGGLVRREKPLDLEKLHHELSPVVQRSAQVGRARLRSRAVGAKRRSLSVLFATTDEAFGVEVGAEEPLAGQRRQRSRPGRFRSLVEKSVGLRGSGFVRRLCVGPEVVRLLILSARDLEVLFDDFLCGFVNP